LLVFNTLFDLEVWGLFYFILVGFSGVRKWWYTQMKVSIVFVSHMYILLIRRYVLENTMIHNMFEIYLNNVWGTGKETLT
jgi:hypothetical protein